MKKRYTYSIISIICAMLASISFYFFRTSEEIKNNDKEDEFVEISELEDSQTYNYLSPNLKSTAKTIRTQIFTTKGFENLSTNYERICYNMIKNQSHKISNEKQKNGLYPIDTITVPRCKLTSLELKKILYAIQNDNPDIFWISSGFSYQYSGNNTVIKLNSIFSKKEQEIALKNLSDKVNNIVSEISANSTDYEIELAMHDYIIKNCKYQRTQKNGKDDPKIYTCYGCLIDNVAVCQGYAKAMQLLMNTVGLECNIITGSRNDEPHMWNVVKINGNWYHLDVTWDASGGLQGYDYLNVNDSIIKKDHKINEEISKVTKLEGDKVYNFFLPKCNTLKENYYQKNAIKIKSLDTNVENTIAKNLINRAKRKEKLLYIMADGNLKLNTLKDYLISQKSNRLFKYINLANQSLSKSNKINVTQLKYRENTSQKVLVVQLIYN